MKAKVLKTGFTIQFTPIEFKSLLEILNEFEYSPQPKTGSKYWSKELKLKIKVNIIDNDQRYYTGIKLKTVKTYL